MITLRAFHPDDESRLVELANNDRVTRYLRDVFPRPYTRLDARYWIEEGSCSALGQHFAISLQGDCIGSIGVTWGKGEFQFGGEVGYWLGEPYWGQGYTTEALGQFTQWLLAKTELVRFYAFVVSVNEPSMRVLEKNGYQREGVQRLSVCKAGQLYDEHLFARIRQ